MPRCRVLARRRLKTSRSLIAATCCSNNRGGAHGELAAAHRSSITFQLCPRLSCPNHRVPPACREEFVPAGLKQARLPFQFLGGPCGLEAVFPPVFPEK
jgi:hypothetical protein